MGGQRPGPAAGALLLVPPPEKAESHQGHLATAL